VNRGLAIVAFPSEFGQRIFEVPIPSDTKFVSKDGKKMKDGLKDPTFQSANNRLQIPVKIQYGTGGSAGTIKKITLQ